MFWHTERIGLSSHHRLLKKISRLNDVVDSRKARWFNSYGLLGPFPFLW